MTAICRLLGYALGSSSEDRVLYTGTVVTVSRGGKTVAQYAYLGNLGALLFCLRHPFGLLVKS